MASSWRDVILHWKKKLEKNPSEDKILEIFGKLKKVPISIELLQETSIGKCVNSFKKVQGDVGEEARLLISNWKNHVKPGNVGTGKDPNTSQTKMLREPEPQKKFSKHSSSENKYKNSYLDHSHEDRGNNGEYSPRTNAHYTSPDEEKYLNRNGYDDNVESEEIEDSYNPSSTVNDYKSYRKYQDTEISQSKRKSDGKHSSHHSSVDKNSKSEWKKEKSPTKKESSSHQSSSKSSSSTKHSSKSDKKHSGKSKKINKNLDEFTNSVASFEACLGFNDSLKTKSKAKPKPGPGPGPIPSPSQSQVNGTSSSGGSGSGSKKMVVRDSSDFYDPEFPDIKTTSHPLKRKSEKLEPRVPEELKKPKLVPPLEVDILSTLPDIQPNYKPLRHRIPEDISAQKKKSLSNEEAILFTSSRNEKTAVYAGRKHGLLADVPSLFDCCIKVLTENIGDLGYTGGVPYDLLKPILEKCSPAQLYTFEDFNNYLLEDTDELWHAHCLRDFKMKLPLENETWRDLYLRLYDEREERLKNITANISASMKKAVPVRTTKLAYVDSVAKPPRDVARRQQAHGTALPNGFKLKAGPPSKATPRPIVGALNSAAAAASSQSSSSAAQLKKPKVAPLMQKTLKLMKQRFRR